MYQHYQWKSRNCRRVLQQEVGWTYYRIQNHQNLCKSSVLESGKCSKIYQFWKVKRDIQKQSTIWFYVEYIQGNSEGNNDRLINIHITNPVMKPLIKENDKWTHKAIGLYLGVHWTFLIKLLSENHALKKSCFKWRRIHGNRCICHSIILVFLRLGLS